ncbi:hypothetical protein NC651_039375 [Populus alba x Populus x berolinensis]|nr:hypothetical protein NC651_039375 [Populus alba x Populus x berolinensis]
MEAQRENSCRRKTEHQQDEEDEVKILYLDSRCPARAALLKQYSERREQKAQAREDFMVLRNNLLGTENEVNNGLEDFGISNLFDLNNVNAWTPVVC